MKRNRRLTGRSLKRVLGVLVAALLAIAAQAFTADRPALVGGLSVVKVIDGDSLRLSDGKDVRLIGVDCPEFTNKYRNAANAKRLGVNAKAFGGYAEKAHQFLNRTAAGKQVALEYDSANEANAHRDTYGRVLAYVHLDGDNLNARMIREGFCFAYRRFEFKYRDAFIAYEAEAKAQHKGFWAHPRRTVDRDQPDLAPQFEGIVIK